MSKGLGRGLEGLFEDNAPLIDKIDEKQLLFVKISDVEPNRDQPRKAFDKQALEELSASVADRGLLQPIIARKIDGDRYQIVSGERRWRAARMAGLTEVPVIVKNLSDKEALEIGLIENLQRENLNVVEEAKGYKALIDEFSVQREASCRKGREIKEHLRLPTQCVFWHCLTKLSTLFWTENFLRDMPAHCCRLRKEPKARRNFPNL